jgi:RNA polymerase sigma-70 factor (ECF subfamily)
LLRGASGGTMQTPIIVWPEMAVTFPLFGVSGRITMAGNPDGLIPTRRSLITRLKNWDDQESWKDFFDTYWKLIYGVAIKAGLNDAEAQEVVQETIIAVAKQMEGFKYDPKIGSFKGWLLHTTRWRISDQLRKRRGQARGIERECKTSRTATVERIPDPAGSNLETIWEQEWRTSMFAIAIEKVKRRVDARQYQIFDLYVIKQWPVKKVAVTLDVKPGQVYLAKHRISELVKKELADLEGKMI